jgi:hypothetical protein
MLKAVLVSLFLSMALVSGAMAKNPSNYRHLMPEADLLGPREATTANTFNTMLAPSSSLNSAAARPSVRPSSLTFVPVPVRSGATARRGLARAMSAMPGMSSSKEDVTTVVWLMDVTKSTMTAQGLDPNNVAHAFSVYWLSAWNATQTMPVRLFPQHTIDAVKAQAERGFLASPVFARASDAQKQNFAETMILTAAFLTGAGEGATSNSDEIRRVADAAREGARQIGLDLTTMELTPNGFVRKPTVRAR